ncbi:hypothetical protein [Actinomadura macrotermitis]|uniref:Uncharacterized protein n=1 Tax=Actinomadura macrotermitis TaxID=2585200 RepID=A0A7K0CAM7_9ACTN|nr:hypothetical protein [Actinomadura macrotermitis]MQY09824.1 hypothetical protein [Actinomadura macrotermitis]
MADPWNGSSCAQCKGRGEVAFIRRDGYWSSVKCWVCEGAGRPSAQGPRPPFHADEPRGPLPPISDHPAVRDSGLCRVCLGAGVVVTARTYAEADCPACFGSGDD